MFIFVNCCGVDPQGYVLNVKNLFSQLLEDQLVRVEKGWVVNIG